MPLFSDLSAADLAHSDEVDYQRLWIEEEDAKDRIKEKRNDDEDEDYEQQSSQDSYWSSSQASQVTAAASSQPHGSAPSNEDATAEGEGNEVHEETIVEGGSVRAPSVSDSEPEDEEPDFEISFPEHVLPSSQPRPEDGAYRLHSRKIADLDYVEDYDDEEEGEDGGEED